MEYSNVDEYIALYQGDIKDKLSKIRKTILDVEPKLIEKLSWKMPTYWLGKNIIHFAVGKYHIGIYPGSNAIIKFQKRLKTYKTSKGAIQLPNNLPVPYDLIEDIVKYNLKTT